MRPSTSRQANARTSPLVKNGIVNNAIIKLRRREPEKRAMALAAGRAIAVEIAAVSSARPPVRTSTASGRGQCVAIGGKVEVGLDPVVAGSKRQKLQTPIRMRGRRAEHG